MREVFNERLEQPNFQRIKANQVFYDPVKEIVNVLDIWQLETLSFSIAGLFMRSLIGPAAAVIWFVLE